MILSEIYKKRLQKLAGLNENIDEYSPAMQQTIDIIKNRLLSSPFDRKHIDLIHNYLKKHSDWFDKREILALKVIAGDIVRYSGDLELYNLPITHLGNLESVHGDLNLHTAQIKNLNNLKYVSKDLALSDTPIKNLGKLEYVGEILTLNDLIKKKDLPQNLVVNGVIISSIISPTSWPEEDEDYILSYEDEEENYNLSYENEEEENYNPNIKENYTQSELLNQKTQSDFEKLINADLEPSEQETNIIQQPEYENLESFDTVETKPEDLAAKAENLYPGKYRGMYAGEHMMEEDVISKLDENSELIIDF